MNIVFLLVLVIFVYKLLFSNFGLMSDDDKRKSDAANNFIKNVNNTATDNSDNKTEKKVITIGNTEDFNKIYKNYLNRITNKQKTPDTKVEFDENKFLKSAEKAIGIIMDAFSEKRLDVLERMLTKDLFQIFKRKIEENLELIYKSVIVAVTEKSIESKVFNKKSRNIVLKITMEQINYVEDVQGELVSGSKSKTFKITEFWTFVQNQSKDLVNDEWLLKSIESM